VKRIALALAVVAAALASVAAAAQAPARAASAVSCRPALSTLTLSAAAVPGGARDTLRLTLTCKTQVSLTVRLKGFAGASVPASVQVPRHQATATATVQTATTHAARHGEIEATAGAKRLKTGLTITRTPRSCRTPTLSGLQAPDLVYVGDHPVLALRLSCAPTAGVRLTLSSASQYLPVPRTITVGRYYDYADVTLTPMADEAGQYDAAVTVRDGKRSLTTTITVDPGLSLFEILAVGNQLDAVSLDILVTGRIPVGGVTISLHSSSPAVTVPATLTISEPGSLGVTNPAGVTVQPVTQDTPVTLSATLGSRTLNATTVLLPPFDSSDSAALTPVSDQGNVVYGGATSLEYQLTLSNPVPASGLAATFSSPSTSLELQPASDYISAGFNEDWVDVNVADVTSPVSTELQAAVDGVTATLPVTVEPGLASITGVPSTIEGGSSFTATVSLAGPVDAATTIGLQGDSSLLTIPGLVTIPPGQSSASFTVSTAAVSADTSVFFGAALGTTTLYSDWVTLTPAS
jgi:hypothetical protein